MRTRVQWSFCCRFGDKDNASILSHPSFCLKFLDLKFAYAHGLICRCCIGHHLTRWGNLLSKKRLGESSGVQPRRVSPRWCRPIRREKKCTVVALLFYCALIKFFYHYLVELWWIHTDMLRMDSDYILTVHWPALCGGDPFGKEKNPPKQSRQSESR